MSYRANSDPAKLVLTDEERKRARTRFLKKSLSYFEDRNNRSFSEDCIIMRRKNLAEHLGVDETVSKRDSDMINVCALPMRLSVQRPLENLYTALFR